jgi:hypothetical protein
VGLLCWLVCAGIGGSGEASETLNLKAAGAAVQRALKDLSTDKAEQVRYRLGGDHGKGGDVRLKAGELVPGVVLREQKVSDAM